MIEGIRLFILDIMIRGWLLLITYIAVEHVFHVENLKLYACIILIALLAERIFYYVKYWDFITMPYSLKLITRPTSEAKEGKIYLDQFMHYDKKHSIAYFYNRNAIKCEEYQLNRLNEIVHFLGIHDKPIEVDIKPHKSKEVKLHFYRLPLFIECNNPLMSLEHGKIFYGYYKEGKYLVALENQTHMITVGESGSGKSNFMNLLILSLLHNESMIDHIVMIDLKAPELSRYQYIANVSFVDSVEAVDTLFQRLKELMNERFQHMKKHNELVYSGKPIYVIFDEVGTVGTHHDKKLKDSIFANMIELFQKGRAAKIILLLFAQKIDSTNIPTNVLTNIQSKVLMKTDSDFNVNNTIGTQEDIQLITKTKVADFNKGRAIVKDGITSEKHLIQVPYISEKTQNLMIRYFEVTIE
ncbi:FtsK/SpoIIIE domain-containing protein [Sulfurospirillum sp. MES]|uniref:FtsK/SpoIIIE domain-containing protein n=1 Tax=Sulfurospirillum sp. MES TaxID=1565314 RepID=UPI00054357A6|nr:FtsK/SpoIIIE domain-containing protein [Sulfurospirillum sp. MES]KHG33017.1 MAG: hypothetical protein OA34_12140 [Sulfurospirillum sp. MES]